MNQELHQEQLAYGDPEQGYIDINALVFNQEFRVNAANALKQTGYARTMQWLTGEIKMRDLYAQKFIKSIMKKEGW